MAVGRGRVSEAPPIANPYLGSTDTEGTTSDDTRDLSIMLPKVGFENPGATRDLRGVEPNTGKQSEGGNSEALTPEMYRSSFSEMGEAYPTEPDPHEGVS